MTASPHVLLIDNYDSFTYNLVHFLQDVGARVSVVRNDAMSAEDVVSGRPDAIVLSPGPCTPSDAGVCIDIIKSAPANLPILGVCLGHQAIAEAYGCTVSGAKAIIHGKVWAIRHSGAPLFDDISETFDATRYHSLAVEDAAGKPIEVIARSADGEIMALKVQDRPVWGVQFHPESVGTPDGKTILRNFLRLAAAARPPKAVESQ